MDSCTLDLQRYRSLAIDYLERTFIDHVDVGILFIYCNYKEEQSIENLLGSLLQQLTQRRSDISDNIRSLYNSHIRKNTSPSLNEYSKLLQTEIRLFSKTFIIIDALDECSKIENRHALLRELRKLLPTAFLLITSRPHITDIPQYFERFSLLEIRASNEDIKAYIEERIIKHNRLNGFIQNDDVLRNAIIETILGNVKGM